MNILVLYSNDKYKQSKKFSSITAKYLGKFDKIISYSPKDISTSYYEKNKEILKEERGNGLWLWKPYFIYKTLCEVNENDVVFYCDAGAFFIRNVSNILKIMRDIWVTDLPLIEEQFTKEETFVLMDCMEEKYRKSNQIQATFMGFRKTKETIVFVKEWLEFCENKNVLNSCTNDKQIENKSVYISHREDQSVLSLLCKKHNINTHLDPTQYGRFPSKYFAEGRLFEIPKHKKEYPVCIILHRKPNICLETYLKQFLLSFLPIKIVSKYINNR